MAAVGARTIPWSWYTSAEIASAERERIFRRFWQYAGHAGQVAEPGSFATTRAGAVPVVLVRDRGGTLRAFVNVCRHRGSLVCEGEGRRETLQCPYHAWTYDLDGSLRSAPRLDREPGFDRDALGLVPVRLESWGPLLFVNPDADAPPLADFLDEVPAAVADGGVDVDSLAWNRRAGGDYAANWKLCCENYLECYHCAIAHPSFSKTIDVAPDAYALSTGRWHSSQFGDPRGGAGSAVRQAQFHFLFPNTVVNVMPGHPNLSIGPVFPDGPERTSRFLDYFFAPGAPDDWLSAYFELDDRVGDEDRILVERVQQGVASGAVAEGALMPESERLVAHFQALVAEALDEAAGS